MKCVKLNGWRLATMTILALPGGLACVQGTSTPPDNLEVVTDAVQTAAQLEARQDLAGMYNLEDNVAGAFLRSANIDLAYHNTPDDLPAPDQSPNNPDWPDDFTYQSVYDNYANAHHDAANYPWVIFYVNHYHSNPTTGPCPAIQVGSTLASPNVAQSDPTRRWSFLFVTDIWLKEMILCSPPPLTPPTPEQFENEMIHWVTHEYGHQRAGLTNNSGTNTVYHSGSVPSNRQDAMVVGPTLAELWNHTDPVFDENGIESPGDHGTCRGNLLSNRLVSH